MLPKSYIWSSLALFFLSILATLAIKAGPKPQSPNLVNACTSLTDPAQIPSPTLIDFDELPDGEVIGSIYQTSHGVIFDDSGEQRAEATFSVLAASPFNVAKNQPVPPNVSNNFPMVIRFESLQTHVGFFVGNSGDGDFTATLLAFDTNGLEVCSYAVEPVPDPHTVFMGVYDPTQSIAWVMLDYGDTEIVESIDDLYFSAATPPPTATFTPLPTNTATATPTPSQTPTPTATLIPLTDLVADDLEITQGIQNLDNEVFLVAGKRTFVRFYTHGLGDYPTIARLKLQKGTAVTYVYPIAPGGPYLKVRPYHLRLLPGHAFLFELPSGFREGTVNITAELNFTNPIWRPAPNPLETNFDNNFMSRTVTFVQMPTVPLVIASQPYRPTGFPDDFQYSSTFIDQWMLFSWLKRAYPVNNVQLYLRTLPIWENATRKWVPDENDPTKGDYTLTYPNCFYVNAYLLWNKAAIINSWFYHKDIHMVGLVSDTYGFMRGCAGVAVASGPSGSGNWGWDYDGTYADWYGGHELAHTYGRPHTQSELPKGCGEEGTVKQHTNGHISPTANIFDRKAIYGFDPYFMKSNPILGPDWHDVMTYCDKQWVSDITYIALKDYLSAAYSPPNTFFAETAQVSPTDRLAIFGAINLQTGQISTLLPMSVWSNADDIEPRTPGSYAIVLLGSSQNELARYPFSLDKIDMGVSPLSESEPRFANISELVPYVDGTTQVNIEGPGGILLASVSAGLAAPTVQLLSPNGGEILSNDPITISWTAVDADNDPLFFNLYYSPDSGSSWDPVAMGITGTQAILPNSNLWGSSSALFRVEASDGIHTANDTSDAIFAVPNHSPSVTIFTPDTDVTIAVSQTLALEAFAYDVELGLMDTTLTWSSSLDGALGKGAQLSTASLSAGVHLITALADDGQGGAASDNVTVTVVATPDDLPPTPDMLLTVPANITLYSMGGEVTTTVGIDNQNPMNDIPWQVASDQPWLTVDTLSGSTFSAITLHANATGLVPGTYEATLMVSRPDGGGPDTAVPVKLIVKPFNVYLPTLIK